MENKAFADSVLKRRNIIIFIFILVLDWMQKYEVLGAQLNLYLFIIQIGLMSLLIYFAFNNPLANKQSLLIRLLIVVLLSAIFLAYLFYIKQ